MSFSELGLSQPLLRAVTAQEYSHPTPIQSRAIPEIAGGRDLLGCAQTGTGKTAAFALPTLQRLMASQPAAAESSESRSEQPSRDPAFPRRQARGGHPRQPTSGPSPNRRKLRALVLAPTRELAAQIGQSFVVYGQYTGLRSTVIFGGVSQGPQVRALQHGVDILVATPGRLLDLMEQGYVRLGGVEILILDEADQMLDMGFLPALKQIVSQVPAQRQTLLFSATMPAEIRRLADAWLRQPVEINVAPAGTPAERVRQSVYLVEPRDKPHLLTHFLEQTPRSRTLVFTRTKHGADRVVKHLQRSGIQAAAIHGNKSQSVRQRALAEFKSERPPVLVATDIAARGLDIDDVSHVINFDMPMVPELYVHRIGRTGRAGAEGVAVSFCGREEQNMLRQIERLTRRNVAVTPFQLPAGVRKQAETDMPARPAHVSSHGDHSHQGSRGFSGQRPKTRRNRNGKSRKPVGARGQVKSRFAAKNGSAGPAVSFASRTTRKSSSWR